MHYFLEAQNYKNIFPHKKPIEFLKIESRWSRFMLKRFVPELNRDVTKSWGSTPNYA